LVDVYICHHTEDRRRIGVDGQYPRSGPFGDERKLRNRIGSAQFADKENRVAGFDGSLCAPYIGPCESFAQEHNIGPQWAATALTARRDVAFFIPVAGMT
jgi:hypothetical protein